MNEYNGSELFGRHYNIFPGCCCCIRPTYIVAARKCHVIHMRRLGQSSCATVRDKKKEQQNLWKAHYFYFKINIISKSTTAFVLTRI